MSAPNPRLWLRSSEPRTRNGRPRRAGRHKEIEDLGAEAPEITHRRIKIFLVYKVFLLQMCYGLGYVYKLWIDLLITTDLRTEHYMHQSSLVYLLGIQSGQ